MKKSTLLFVLLVSGVWLARAQDIHYSQFYSSPIILNPALTGINDCNYRVTAMYRNQWSSISDPYQTPSIAFDMNNVLQRIITSGTLSLGGYILDERAGTGHLNNLTIMGSVAYQHAI